MEIGKIPIAAGLLGLLALSVTPSPAGAAPAAFEKLGTFIGQGGQKGSLVGPGPNGTERIYTNYTYISSMDVVAFERGSGKFKVWRSPEGGAWATEVGPDGRIYYGTYYNGHILRLDPATDTLDDLGQAIPGETYVWELSLGPDGMLYGATFPGSKLLRFDPATGKSEDLGRMDPVDKYNRHVVAAPDGWVYCATGSEKANLVAFNPKTKERRSFIPEAERRAGFGKVVRGADGNAYGTYFGKIYRLHNGAATEIEKLPPLRDRMRYKDGAAAAVPKTYVGRELPIFRVATGPDGKIYGSSVLPEYLLRFDPADGKPVTMGLIPGAEAYSMLAAHDKLYIASYTGATLQVYDPAKPFKPGQKRENNPAYYGSTAPNQNRPYDMVQGSDGRIYIANVPGYGIVGGALAWYDPATDKVDSVPTPIENHSLASLCPLPGSRLLVGTSIEAGSGARAVAKEAVLFLWDTEKRQVVWQTVPIPGASILSNMALGGDGLVYLSAGKEVFAFDPEKRAVVARTTLDQGIIRAGMEPLPDGRVAALTPNAALLLRAENGKVIATEFARSDTPLNVGKAVLDGWLYAASDNVLMRCRIP